MTQVLSSFPDVQAILKDVLADFGTYGIQTDAHLEDKLPFVTSRELGGQDNRITDATTVDIDVFASSYAGKGIAESIRQTLTAAPLVTATGIIDTCTTQTKPHEVPWTDGSTVRRWTATYRITARR